MLFAVLSACLAADPAPAPAACGPVLLSDRSFDTVASCREAAPRMAGDWLADHPGLVRGGVACRALSDLPALPLQPVAEGVHVHIGEIAQFEDSPDGWIANLGVVIGRDGIAVIDAGTSRAQGQALLAAIRTLSDTPISHLILTHMHPDHVLGASVFAEAGATVVGHARLADALQARGPVYLDNMTRLYGPGAMIGTRLALPDVAVSGTLDIDLGDRVLTLTAVGPAHSDTDLTVLDRATGTLFAGDLVFRGLTPIVDGSLTGWLDWIEGMDHDGPVVPGHGPVADGWAEAVGAQRTFLAALHEATRRAVDAGLPLSRAVPAIVAALRPLAGDWAAFPDSAARNATAAFSELEWQ